MTRHRWSKAERFPSKTERYCLACGLIRITRHVRDDGRERGLRDKNGCLVWTEWWTPAGSDGMPEKLDFPGTETPACTRRAPHPVPLPKGEGTKTVGACIRFPRPLAGEGQGEGDANEQSAAGAAMNSGG